MKRKNENVIGRYAYRRTKKDNLNIGRSSNSQTHHTQAKTRKGERKRERETERERERERVKDRERKREREGDKEMSVCVRKRIYE